MRISQFLGLLAGLLIVLGSDTQETTTYTIVSSVLGSDVTENVKVQLGNGRIMFKSCNNNVNGYTIGADGSFSVSTPWASTMMFCFKDHDREIANVFNSATKAIFSQSTVTFYNAKN
jgi:hypothetical protein